MDIYKNLQEQAMKPQGNIQNENATTAYNSNGGKGDFQKIKRMLFYKLNIRT